MPATKPDQRHANTPRKLRRELLEDFQCERRGQTVLMHECMTYYVNANALQKKSSACFNCSLGLEHRTAFAKRS